MEIQDACVAGGVIVRFLHRLGWNLSDAEQYESSILDASILAVEAAKKESLDYDTYLAEDEECREAFSRAEQGECGMEQITRTMFLAELIVASYDQSMLLHRFRTRKIAESN